MVPYIQKNEKTTPQKNIKTLLSAQEIFRSFLLEQWYTFIKLRKLVQTTDNRPPRFHHHSRSNGFNNVWTRAEGIHCKLTPRGIYCFVGVYSRSSSKSFFTHDDVFCYCPGFACCVALWIPHYPTRAWGTLDTFRHLLCYLYLQGPDLIKTKR